MPHQSDVSRTLLTRTAKLRSTSQLVKNMVGAAVMGSPPTVTTNTSNPATNTSLTGGLSATVLYAYTDTAFRYPGQQTLQVVATNGGVSYITNYVTNTSLVLGQWRLPWFVSFEHYGQAFEMLHYGTVNGRWRVWANEQPHSASGVAVGSGFTPQSIMLDFGSVARRRIVFEFWAVGANTGVYFGGIRTLKTDSLSPTPAQSPIKALTIGDSLSVGAGADGSTGDPSPDGYVWRMGRALGIDDIGSIGYSGSGVLHQANYYSARFVNDLYPRAPDILLYQGSVNENQAPHLSPAGQIQTQATADLYAIRANLPNCQIVVCGPLAANNSFATQVNSEMSAAATAAGVPFIDTTGWFGGSGHVGATTGDGVNDYYSYDGTHCSAAGYAYLGNRMAAAVATALGMSVE